LARDTAKIRFVQNEIQKRINVKNHIWSVNKFNSLVNSFQVWESGKSGASALDDGVDCWAHQFEAIGNGQVPRVAAAAFHLLKHRLDSNLHKS
jgi:hypothetical protein